MKKGSTKESRALERTEKVKEENKNISTEAIELLNKGNKLRNSIDVKILETVKEASLSMPGKSISSEDLKEIVNKTPSISNRILSKKEIIKLGENGAPMPYSDMTSAEIAKAIDDGRIVIGTSPENHEPHYIKSFGQSIPMPAGMPANVLNVEDKKLLKKKPICIPGSMAYEEYLKGNKKSDTVEWTPEVVFKVYSGDDLSTLPIGILQDMRIYLDSVITTSNNLTAEEYAIKTNRKRCKSKNEKEEGAGE